MSLFGDIIGFVNAGRAGSVVSNANIAAEHGVLDATTGATGAIESQLGKSYNDVGAAGANVNAAAGTANSTLQQYLDSVKSGTSPYTTAGTQGVGQLANYAANQPNFSFSPGDVSNDPGYQFQLAQGQKAITNSASAQGLGASGSALMDLEKYGQGLAGTYYQQAFDRAKSSYDTNQNATLQTLNSLIQPGLTGTAMNTNATQNFGLQQGANITGAASQNATLQQFLAGLGLQGQETAGKYSMTGADTAGNFGASAANATAAGILGQGNNLTAGVSDLGSLLLKLGIGGGGG